MTVRYYDKIGIPMSREDWTKKFSDIKYQIIVQYRGFNVFVSTVWLGLDHQFDSGKPPLIFETMVFAFNFESINCERYSTLTEAEKGYRRLVYRYWWRFDIGIWYRIKYFLNKDQRDKLFEKFKNVKEIFVKKMREVRW